MSINLELNIDQFKSEDLKMHFIPAKLDSSVSANVDNYFNFYTKEEKAGFLSNALRGYPLQGCEFKVPEKYKGIVFQETKKPLDEDSDRIFKASGVFDSFTYWNYDKVPSSSDAIKQALQIIPITNKLAGAVSLDEVEQFLKEDKENN
ncbi:RNASEH2C family protein [Megaselia abdita]